MRALPNCRIITEVDVPSPGNVQRIVLRNLSASDKVLAEVTEPDRVAEILAAVNELMSDASFTHLQEPAPAEEVIQFVGRSRVLCEIRLGNKSLQINYPGVWTKQTRTDKELVTLRKQLLTDSP